MEVDNIDGKLNSLFTYKDWLRAHQSDIIYKYSYKGNYNLNNDYNNNNILNDDEFFVENYKLYLNHDILNDVRNRGLEPCTLGDVLLKRNKFWAKTQLIHSTARDDYIKYKNLYHNQFESYNKSADGWINENIHKDKYSRVIKTTIIKRNDDKVWSNVIFCPNFKPGGEIVHRFSRRSVKLYKQLYDVIVKGWVHPSLIICEITDATHPVRFATPPNNDCYTAIYNGPEIPSNSTNRIIFGEYTGIVYREDCISDSVFEYAFELTFSPASWVNAELDLTNDTTTTTTTTIKDYNGCVYLPSNTRFVLDSSIACNELSLVNHCQSIKAYGGEFWLQPNCEWQQVIFDGWPHVVLTSKLGVGIKPGDELVADFGALWFSKVEETAHRLLRRELIEYRIGIRKNIAKGQKIFKTRSLDDTDLYLTQVNSSSFTCAICLEEKRSKDYGIDRDRNRDRSVCGGEGEGRDGSSKGSDGSSIMGMMEDGSKDMLDVTSSGMMNNTGPQVEPGSDLRELEGEVNREASTASGKEVDCTSGGEPAADLREAEGQVNRRGHHGEWKGRQVESRLQDEGRGEDGRQDGSLDIPSTFGKYDIINHHPSPTTSSMCASQLKDNNNNSSDDEEEEGGICCDGCDRIFHLDCLKDINITVPNIFYKNKMVKYHGNLNQFLMNLLIISHFLNGIVVIVDY